MGLFFKCLSSFQLFLQHIAFFNLGNCCDLRFQAFEFSILEEVSDIVHGETDEEVVDDDGDEDNEGEEEEVDVLVQIQEGVLVLQLPQHHGDGLHEGLDVELESFRIWQQQHEDEGEPQQSGEIDAENHANFLCNLK